MATVVVDDFEDGDITISATDWSGWTGSTTQFSASSTGPISGSFSGRLDASNADRSVFAARTTGAAKRLDATVRIDSQTGNATDRVSLYFTDSNGDDERLDFLGDGSIFIRNTLSATWSAGTAIDVSFRPDFDNNEMELYLDGSLENTFSLSTVDLDEIEFQNLTVASGSSVSAYIDDIESIDAQLSVPVLTIDATRADEIDISTTFPTDADEVDLYRSETTPVTTGDTLVNTYTSAGQFTDTGLENGERYYYSAVARDTDGDRPDSELAAEVDTITTLPAPTIDLTEATATTRIQIEWTLNDNSTDGDVEVLRNGSSVQSLGIAFTDYEDTLLTEATSYDYEIRRNTDHTSSTSAVDTQFTQPEAPTGATLTLTDSSEDGSVTWTDNSSGEGNYEVEQSRDSNTFTLVSTEPADTTSYDTPSLDRISTYQYRVRATVGSGSSAAESDYSTTDTESFTTYDNYWATVTPVGGSTVDVPTPHVSYVDLEHTAIHGAGIILGNITNDISNWGPKTDIQIFLDEERIFAGEIIRHREDNPREGQTDITAKGPVKELENAGPGSKVTYSDELVYLAIEDYFDNEITGIDVNATVFAPPGEIQENDTLFISADSSGYAALVETNLDDVPLTASGSYLIEESAFIGVEDDFGGTYTVQADSPGNPPYHISGEWADVDNSETVNYNFTPQHDIPEERVGVAVHLDVQDGAGTLATLSWTLNGDDLDKIALLNPDSNRWVALPDDYAGGDLSSGVSYQMQISTGDYAFDVDAMVVYDTDYVSGTFTDVTSLGDTLDNPVPYNPVEIDIADESRPNTIQEARVDATVSNIGGEFQHRGTVTGGASDLTTTNEDDTLDFIGNAQYGTTFEPFLQLDGSGSNAVFSSGVNPQEVTKLDWYLTTTDIASIANIELTGSHYDNLRRLHNAAGMRFVCDPRADPDIDGITIESFSPGSTASQKPVTWTTIDVDVEREFDGYANAVTVNYIDTGGTEQTFVGAADSDEVSRVGTTVRKIIFDSGVDTNDQARIRAVNERRDRIANDKVTGEITAVADFVLPGYSYDITEFGGYTSLDARVSFREGPDDATMELKFSSDKDNVRRLLDVQEDVSDVQENL